MISSVFTLFFAALLAQAASSFTPASPAPTPTPTCVVKVFEDPSFETDCTFYQTTTTSTFYTDCHGCALETEGFGLGLPCQKVTTIEGVATATVTACKRKARYSGGAMPTGGL